MLALSKFEPAYVNQCRARVDADIAAYSKN